MTKHIKTGSRGRGTSSEAKYAATEAAYLKERARVRAANDAKTARLKAQRLAAEAAQRLAAADKKS